MKKRNKAYRPRTVVQNPLNYFLGGLKKLDEEHLTELNLKNHAAVVSICQGRGTRDDWDKLVGMMNMALVLAETHFDLQYHELLIAGRDALQAIGKRWLTLRKFVFRASELQALNDAIEVHEAQLAALRVIDVERAFDEVQRRVRLHINTVKVVAEDANELSAVETAPAD